MSRAMRMEFLRSTPGIPSRETEVPMPSYEEVTQRAGSLRAMTGLTQPAFLALWPPFEHAFLAYMAHHTIDGQPRTSRRDRTDDHTPLPTMADRLLFILTSFTRDFPDSTGLRGRKCRTSSKAPRGENLEIE
jgi:hypothetical protein